MADYKIKHEPYVELRLSMTDLNVLRRVFSTFDEEHAGVLARFFEGEDYESYSILSDVLWEITTSSVCTDYVATRQSQD